MGKSTAILIARRARERAAREAGRRTQVGAVAADPNSPIPGTIEERPDNAASGVQRMPAGYTATHVNGGYYRLKAPNGSVVEGPSNGKWQGEDGAVQGAWAHLTDTGGT